jgi:hypothetical protein
MVRAEDFRDLHTCGARKSGTHKRAEVQVAWLFMLGLALGACSGKDEHAITELDFHTPSDGSGGSGGGAGKGSGGTGTSGRGGSSANAGRGGSTSAGGSGAGSAGRGGSSGSSTSGGDAGEAGSGEILPEPPEVEEVSPSEGAYGTRVTIRGSWLGSSSRAGSALVLAADAGDLILEPDSDAVESWSEEQIVFRYPFPASGGIKLETSEGDAEVGEFEPTWRIVRKLENAPAASVVASISTAAGSISMLLEGSPPSLLELSASGVSTHDVTLNGAVGATIRLYASESGALEGVGISNDASPELVHFSNDAGSLVGASTGIPLDASEYVLAGGTDGASAWMLQSSGWMRARPTSAGWAIDKGPISDPQASSPDHAVGTSSDGSLYVAWSVDAGNFLDDMERPMLRRLPGAEGAWSTNVNGGGTVDDYVTGLEFLDKGRGVVLRSCGSDVDPFGLSGTDYYCFDALHAQGGGSILGVPVDATSSRHAFSADHAVAGYCDDEDTFRLRSDDDPVSETEPTGEAVVYPCQTTFALEIDPSGEFVPVIRAGSTLYLLGRNE